MSVVDLGVEQVQVEENGDEEVQSNGSRPASSKSLAAEEEQG